MSAGQEQLSNTIRQYFRNNDRDPIRTLDAVLAALHEEGASVRHTYTPNGGIVMSTQGKQRQQQDNDGRRHGGWVPKGLREGWVVTEDSGEDRRARAHHNAWGRRNLALVQKGAYESESGSGGNIGRINPVALHADPVLKYERTPSGRQAGAWCNERQYYQRYSYYRKYGNAGRGAVTAHVHNFPGGTVPIE
eukprot:PhF_6_TR24022/c0_g1_i4/m.33638